MCKYSNTTRGFVARFALLASTLLSFLLIDSTNTLGQTCSGGLLTWAGLSTSANINDPNAWVPQTVPTSNHKLILVNSGFGTNIDITTPTQACAVEFNVAGGAFTLTGGSQLSLADSPSQPFVPRFLVAGPINLNGVTVDAPGISAIGTSGGGTVNVTGPNSLLRSTQQPNTGWLAVGAGSLGRLYVSSGGTVEANSLFVIADFFDSFPSRADVTDSGSRIDTYYSEIGKRGRGSLGITNGATFTSQADFSVGVLRDSPPSQLHGIGSVLVADPGSRLETAYTLGSTSIGVVGEGTMTVRSGGAVTSGLGDVNIGLWPESSGEVLVSGSGSSWSMQASGASLYVGRYSTGSLTIESAATVSANRDIVLGLEQTSVGHAIVRNLNSSLSVNTTRVAEYGQGSLIVEDGAQFNSRLGFFVGDGFLNGVAGDGTVTVSGPMTRMNLAMQAGPTTIGRSGNGAMFVYNGAMVTSGGGSVHIAGQPGSSGILALRDSNTTWTMSNSGTGFFVGRLGTGVSAVESGAKIFSAGPVHIGWKENAEGTQVVSGIGSELQTQASILVGRDTSFPNTKGTLRVDNSGQVGASNEIAVKTTGQVILDNGILNTPVVNVFGSLTGGGNIQGALNSEGRVEVGASDVLNVSGGADFRAGSELIIHVDGASAGSFGQINVTGSSIIGGTLRIEVGNNYVPQQGQTLSIINCSTICLGEFDSIITVGTDGIIFTPIYENGVVKIRAEPVAFKGRVVMGPRNLPLQGVRVSAVPVPSIPGWNFPDAITDTDGGYKIAGLPQANDYTISAKISFHEYNEPSAHAILNYPANNPNRSWRLLLDRETRVDTIRFPLPIFLQAGWNGGLDTWSELYPYLSEDPKTFVANGINIKATLLQPAFLATRIPSVNSGTAAWAYNNTGCVTTQYDDNALVLLRHILRVIDSLWPHLSASNRSKLQVNIIGHSMGGIIARALATSDFGFRLDRIVTLDSPHGGTARVQTLNDNISSCNSSGSSKIPWALSESAMNGHIGTNQTVFGWNFGHREPESSTRTWLTYSAEELVEVVFPDESAFGIGRILHSNRDEGARLNAISAPNKIEKSINISHSEIHDDIAAISEYVDFILGRSIPHNDDFSGTSNGGSGSSFMANEPGYLSWSQTAAPGQSSQRTLSIDSNTEIVGQLMVAGSGSTVSIVDALGAPLSFARYDIQEVTTGVYIHDFQLSNQPSGDISVELSAGSSEAAELAGQLTFTNGLIASLEVPAIVSGSSSSIGIQAAIYDNVGATLQTSGVVMASILSPSGSITGPFQLFDDGQHGDGAAGDGIYGEQAQTGTLTEGLWQVDLNMALANGSEIVERSSHAQFLSPPTGADFGTTAPTEALANEDTDPEWEALNINLNLDITVTGTYRIAADLLDTNGEKVTELSAEVPQPANGSSGSVQATLRIPGPDLVNHGVSGPWTISNLTLFDLNRGTLPMRTHADFQTLAHSVTIFESPPAPALSGLEPESGPISGNYSATILGQHLSQATRVWLGSNQVSFTVTGQDSLQITIPPTEVTPAPVEGFPNMPIPGLKLTVETPWGQTTLLDAFSYVQ